MNNQKLYDIGIIKIEIENAYRVADKEDTVKEGLITAIQSIKDDNGFFTNVTHRVKCKDCITTAIDELYCRAKNVRNNIFNEV